MIWVNFFQNSHWSLPILSILPILRFVESHPPGWCWWPRIFSKRLFSASMAAIQMLGLQIWTKFRSKDFRAALFHYGLGMSKRWQGHCHSVILVFFGCFLGACSSLAWLNCKENAHVPYPIINVRIQHTSCSYSCPLHDIWQLDCKYSLVGSTWLSWHAAFCSIMDTSNFSKPC